MITTETSQLSMECTAWRDALRTQREKITQSKNELGQLARNETNSELMAEIGHLDNQFHIQLINIHDLRQAIKKHNQRLSEEKKQNGGVLSEETVQHHENLFDDFQRLETTLHGVRQEFAYFVRQARVY